MFESGHVLTAVHLLEDQDPRSTTHCSSDMHTLDRDKLEFCSQSVQQKSSKSEEGSQQQPSFFISHQYINGSL
jgi:hypothetical protein